MPAPETKVASLKTVICKIAEIRTKSEKVDGISLQIVWIFSIFIDSYGSVTFMGVENKYPVQLVRRATY